MSRTWSLRLSRCWTLTVVDVDSRRQQLLDVLPALTWRLPGTLLWASSSTRASAGGSARRPSRSISCSFILDTRGRPAAAAARLRGGTRFPPASGSRPPRRAVSRPGATGLGGLQHGEGLAHPGAAPRKTFRRPRPSAGRSASSVGACGVGHGSVVPVALRRAGRTIAGDHPPMRRYCKPLRGSLGKPSASTPPAPCSAPAR